MKIIVLFVVLLNLVAVAHVQSTHKKRISRTKCEEYSELTKIPGCAIETYPFVGAIGIEMFDETVWMCSVSLISEQFVLTVAHCTYSSRGKVKYVQLGSTYLLTDNNTAEIYTISEIIRHPEYEQRSYYNDIALLKLDKIVQFTPYIRPACLYYGRDAPHYNVAGFSFLTKDFRHTNNAKLLHQNSPFISQENCSKEWRPAGNLDKGVDFETQFCIQEGSKSCLVSSGSPLLYNRVDGGVYKRSLDADLPCVHQIAGLVQLGKKDPLGIRSCDKKSMVNVKVGVYIPWIESIVWP